MSKIKKTKKEQAKNVIQDFQVKPDDTGSSQVQIGLLTKEIKDLAGHLQTNIHDFSSRRGLLKKVNQRRRLLKYLQVNSPKEYEKIVKKIREIK
jgi:small subunit ribosomal protein S15